MVNKTDSLRSGLRPLLDKTLENALSHRIDKEFPRIGGPRIRKLCAEMVLEAEIIRRPGVSESPKLI